MRLIKEFFIYLIATTFGIAAYFFYYNFFRAPLFGEDWLKVFFTGALACITFPFIFSIRWAVQRLIFKITPLAFYAFYAFFLMYGFSLFPALVWLNASGIFGPASTNLSALQKASSLILTILLSVISAALFSFLSLLCVKYIRLIFGSEPK